MNFVVQVVVQAALIYVGWKAWRWARAKERAGRTRWRRRFGLLFYFAPLLLWLAALILPEALQPLVRSLSFLSDGLDRGVARVIGTAKAALEGFGALLLLAVKPVVYALVYGALGLGVGWPLDRLAEARARRSAELDS